jgi:hypothetical protein
MTETRPCLITGSYLVGQKKNLKNSEDSAGQGRGRPVELKSRNDNREVGTYSSPLFSARKPNSNLPLSHN